MAEPRGDRQDGAKQDCFLCALDPHRCSEKLIEGHIRAVATKQVDGEWTPFITLNTGTALISLQLTRYYLNLVRELKRLEQQDASKRLRDYNLKLRVYHLPPKTQTSEFKDWTVHHYQANVYTLAVLEPDILLNITDLSQSEYCARQYLLRQLVTSPPSAAAISGNLVHHSFKELLKEHDRGALMTGYAANGEETPLATLQRHFEQELERSRIDLALANIPGEAIRSQVSPHLESLANWFLAQRSTLWDMPASYSETPGGDVSEQQSENMVRAETFLLAPEIGLRGRLDLLWQQSSRQRLLELKTGKFNSDTPKQEHRWQVLGYHALLTVRRDSKMKKALATLLYSATPGAARSFPIPFNIQNLQRVNEARNSLVLSHVAGLAPAPPGPSRCTRCALLAQCEHVSSLLRWEPPQPDTTMNGSELANGHNGHSHNGSNGHTQPALQPEVTAEDREFFEKFYRLLRMEGLAGEQQQALLWNESLEERVARGAAIQNLQALGEPQPTGQGEWWQTFRCENTSELRVSDEILLSDGDPVTGEVVTGTIIAISTEQITIWTPELIAHPSRIDSYDIDRVHGRTLKNLLRWLQSDQRLRDLVSGQRRPLFQPAQVSRRADFNTEQNRALERAMQTQDYLLVHGPPGTGKTAVIAEIVKRFHQQGQRVLLAAFTNQAVDNMLKRLDKEGFSDYVRLGHERSVAPEIQGHLLKKLFEQQASTDDTGVRVLDGEVVGATPCARPQPTELGHHGRPSPRLSPPDCLPGRPQGVAPTTSGFPRKDGESDTASTATTNHASGATTDSENEEGRGSEESIQTEQTSEIHTLLRRMSVVASTTATWSSDVYDFLAPAGNEAAQDNAPWQFDVAIIDEAGQLTVPSILGALRFAKRFILVGDEKQLPPLVLSEEAAKQGLASSLFGSLKQLDDDYTRKHADALSACVPLRVQYRMNQGICEFASKMFYSGNLVAHPSVAHRVLSGTRGRDRQLQEAPAITRALLPSLPTVFLRVRNDGNMRPKTSDAEARAVRDVVAGLLARGVAEEDIGIIAPYRAQVANLRRYLFNSDEQSNRQNNGQSSWQGLALTSPLTVDTVDRFQGGERKVMIISFATTSAPEANSQLHNFLTNPNRLNVALTRAQRKLILVGYAPALKTLPVFKHLLLYCKYNDALIPYQVPPPLPPKGDHIQSTSASISREVEADLLRNE